jgi:hypothetical protein
VTLEEISSSINSYSEGKYMCIASPLNVGELEVYCNFSEIKPYVQSKLNIPSTDESEERVLLTSDNINFFTCRHIVVDYLKKIPVSGIMGVTKIYPREDLSEKEWVMDVDCGKISAKDVNQRFLNVLTAPEVDPYRTVTDDMHALASILGIEAARRFLIEEMTRILSAEGTYINPRHIALLVDAMTQTGEITSVRRDGIPRDVGPTAKMMFEQAMDNAVQAAAFTEPDSMKSVSSAVMFGMLAKAGTGLVRVKPIDKVPSKPVVPPPSIPPNLEEKSSPSPRSRDSSAEISRRSRPRK